MLKLPTKPISFLARPGLPTKYSLYQAARILGMNYYTLMRYYNSGLIRGRKGRTIEICRSEVIRFARTVFADRPARLARILQESKGGVIALALDPELRRHLSPYNPTYVGSPFALGQILSFKPAAILVIDWEAAGSQWARDIAERLNACPDRPRLVGVLPEYVEEKSKNWDSLISRPFNRFDVQGVIASYWR